MNQYITIIVNHRYQPAVVIVHHIPLPALTQYSRSDPWSGKVRLKRPNSNAWYLTGMGIQPLFCWHLIGYNSMHLYMQTILHTVKCLVTYFFDLWYSTYRVITWVNLHWYVHECIAYMPCLHTDRHTYIHILTSIHANIHTKTTGMHTYKHIQTYITRCTYTQYHKYGMNAYLLPIQTDIHTHTYIYV